MKSGSRCVCALEKRLTRFGCALPGRHHSDEVFALRIQLAVAAFRHLQIEIDALTVDQHRSLIDHLLPRAIEGLVTA